MSIKTSTVERNSYFLNQGAHLLCQHITLRTVTGASVSKCASLPCHYCYYSGKFWPIRDVWKRCGLTWQY